MILFYFFWYKHKFFSILDQLSWSSYYILFKRKLEHFSRIWYWNLSCLHIFLQMPHVFSLQCGADLPHISCHIWPSNTILSFQIIVGFIQQNPDPICGRQLPISIRMITMFLVYSFWTTLWSEYGWYFLLAVSFIFLFWYARGVKTRWAGS